MILKLGSSAPALVSILLPLFPERESLEKRNIKDKLGKLAQIGAGLNAAHSGLGCYASALPHGQCKGLSTLLQGCLGRAGRVYPSPKPSLPFRRAAIVIITALLLQIGIFERATSNKDC